MTTQTINIYLNEKTRKELLNYCSKHHVSFSTIAEKLTYAFVEKQQILCESYLSKGQKTSIKVNSNWDDKLNTNQKAILYTNLLYLYFNKKLKNYFDEERYKRLISIFQKEIDKCEDTYWNYNNHIRNEARMLKNKNTREYLKRKLEQYEKN